MHCHRSPTAFQSDLPTARFHSSQSDAARVLELESELRRLAPAARFRMGGQPRPQLWDVMIRGLKSSESPLSAGRSRLSGIQPLPPQLRSQQPEEEQYVDRESCDTIVVKRSKTNSERGRAFRARRKKYEDELVTIVSSLRQEVADLGFLRSVRAGKALHSRNSMGGSLVRLAREYFALFEYGMPSVRGVGQKRPALVTNGSMDGSIDDTHTLEMKQKTFLASAMDPELQFGEASGPEVLLGQWKRYTSYHARLNVVVVGVEVSGEEDNPMVTVRSDLHVVFSRDTFDHVFPHVAHNEELVNKFIGREVVYHGVNRFQFSPKGQILIYDTDVGFVDALVEAGASVSDIALLMQQARIAESRLGDEGDNNNSIQELEQDNQDEITSREDSNYSNGDGTSDSATDADSDADPLISPENNQSSGPCGGKVGSSRPSRLDIDFLLS